MSFRKSLTQILKMILIVPVALFVSGFQHAPSMQTGSETSERLDRFDLVSPTSGWVLLEHNLFRTEDAGQTWMDMSPSIPAEASVEDVYFLDEDSGWVLWSMVDPNGLPMFQLAFTQDRGAAWTVEDLPLLGQTIPDPEKAEMGWFDTQTGWIAVKQSTGSNFSVGALFTTQDAGLSWKQSWLPVADKIHFNDPQQGWAVGGPSGGQVFRTRDAGESWQETTTGDNPSDGNVIAYPPVVSAEDGLLVATHVGVANLLNVYKLEDSSNSWLPVEQVHLDAEPGVIGLSLLGPQDFVATIPGTNSIVHMTAGQLDLMQNTDGLSESITELDMVSMDIGWGKSVDSSCVSGSAPDDRSVSVECFSTTRLLRTADGGLTWQAVSLPSVSSQSAPLAAAGGQGVATSSSITGWNNTQILTGQGFDKCEIPTLSQMQKWATNGPYQAINLYIGGSSRACDNLALTASYLLKLNQQGWKFIPTWVGPQAPCTGFTSRISLDPVTANNQGVNQANLAADKLASLGLTYPDKTGSIVYYDIEAYGNTNSACRAAVNSFMNGWVSQLHVRGHLAGVYASTVCNTGLADTLTIANVPDAIWAARWYHDQGEGYYDPTASVWTLGSCIPATEWANHQRIRQYEGDHDETWGDLTLGIDSNVLDGVVAIPYTVPGVESITALDPNPTDKASVRFSVTFSRPVTGVDLTDFSLTVTGLSGASIVSESGSLESYLVTVDTGTGDGKVRLDVMDDNSILDGIGNPLGGTGTTDGNFTGGETYTIRRIPTFADVPFSHPYSSDIEILYANGLTAGCSTTPLNFCPDQIMDRGQSAVFMLRGNFGTDFFPGDPTHFFLDDWTKGLWAESWAEAMYNKGLSAGCLASPLKYCPWDKIPREQAAIFALRLRHGPSYTPPAATGTFLADMTNPGYYATAWAEQAYREGLIPDCGTSGGRPKICPKSLVPRGLAAYMIVRAKNLSMP
jgi:photosystem II stability/assembly factor-like uncharacterized protein